MPLTALDPRHCLDVVLAVPDRSDLRRSLSVSPFNVLEVAKRGLSFGEAAAFARGYNARRHRNGSKALIVDGGATVGEGDSVKAGLSVYSLADVTRSVTQMKAATTRSDPGHRAGPRKTRRK